MITSYRLKCARASLISKSRSQALAHLRNNNITYAAGHFRRIERLASRSPFARFNPKEEVFNKPVIDNPFWMIDALTNRLLREIIVLRFGLCGKNPLTLKEVGLVMGIHHAQVWHYEQVALELLRTTAFRNSAMR